jgi:hypothetical protein
MFLFGIAASTPFGAAVAMNGRHDILARHGRFVPGVLFRSFCWMVPRWPGVQQAAAGWAERSAAIERILTVLHFAMNHLQPALDVSWPAASRLPRLADPTHVLSTGLLLGMGALAAVVATMKFGLSIPGNAILRPVLPIVLGLALVPRTGAGTTMSASSLVTLMLMRLLGDTKGLGGTASLLLLGPALDVALLYARPNWVLYLRFALAGMAANGLAFVVQMGAKSFGFSLGGGKDFRSWLSIATITYPLFGLVAGLASGALLFHWSEWKLNKRGGERQP